MTSGPKEMLGTKCPSITSRWIQSAPAASTARTSSPSLAKSEARIDGAMTRGRDANWVDMCAFPKALRSVKERLSRNMRKPFGQCGRAAPRRRKILPLAAAIAGAGGPRDSENHTFYWPFHDGMAFADH